MYIVTCKNLLVWQYCCEFRSSAAGVILCSIRRLDSSAVCQVRYPSSYWSGTGSVCHPYYLILVVFVMRHVSYDVLDIEIA